MSKTREDLSRRSKALSTNNRGFVSSGKRFLDAREHLNDEDDEDVRLETYRRNTKVDAMRSIARHESRGLKSQEILEDSPNGYVISGKAPPEMPRAIKYYSYQLRQYTVTDYPVEYGICHYNLGKIFFADRHHSTRDFEARAKSIENGLHHLRLSVEVFDYDSYPIMYAVINIFIGQLFRERATLISARSILAKRGVTVADSCTIGLSQLMDAAMTFSNAGSHVVENAICHVEIGWLYLLQITEAMLEEGLIDSNSRRKGRPKKAAAEETLMTYREHAITSLEKAEGLLESLKAEPEQTRYGPKKMARGWDPLVRESYPPYMNLLIMNLSLEYIYGLIAYLQGRIFQDWDPGLDHQSQAYDFYKQSVKTHGLPPNCNEYIDAHHRIAQILVQNPAIFDDAVHEDGMPVSDLCYVSATEHLHLALKSPVIKPGRKMDIAFHLAQANIARFHIIVDRVKTGESVVQALVEKDGMDIMRDIERALREAMKGATAANTQSTQDAFVYYYSSIKLSEFRTLQSGMDPALPALSRLKLLTQAFDLLVDALLSRSIVDNLDLHYIATLTMAQSLMSSRCYDSCTMWYTKALMCLSCACNRTQHTPKGIRSVCFSKVETELQIQVEKSLMASSRELKWEKEHLGPLYLTESVTSGYAYWNFEEEYNKPPKPPPEPPKKALTAAEAMENRRPPEKLQPFMSASEREYANRQRLTGEGMQNAEGAAPIGAVPLWAMDHHPEFDKLDEILRTGKFGHTANNQFSERKRATIPSDIHETLLMHVHIVKSQEHVKKNVSLMPKVSFGKKAKKLQPRVERPQLTKIGETKKVRKPGFIGFLTGEMEEVPADLAPGQINADESAVESIPHIDIMASRQCFCFFMTLSRLSRSALILRSNNVKFNYGRRVRDILARQSEITSKTYFDINNKLAKASSNLVVPPTSIRELSRRSFEDLKGVFRSNVEICRLLADYEEFLYTRLAKYDYHIPMICAMPSLTRDICGSDAMLLNPNVMLDTMVEEARRQAQEEEQRSAEDPDNPDAGVYVRDKESPDKDKWRLRSPPKAKATGLDDAAKARIAAAKKQLKKDALDTMGYNLFEKLDGSGFLGGSKHMLSEKLHPNEVIFLWHHPHMDEQKVHLIMIWREESQNYVYRARRRENYKKLKKEGLIDPDLVPNYVHLKDVTMEVCRSEVSRGQLDTLIRNYLKALNQNSAARRISHSTNALRALSSYLSIGEVLLMLPRHIDSIVICCPTFMRLIPWHALLVEIHTAEFGQGATSTAELVAKGKLPKSVVAFEREANILDKSKEEHVPGVEEWHLIEKYMVRMGPTLALFEVCLVLSDELGNAHGTYRMCAIDGEARNLRSPGMRATDGEVACVTATFSGDPDDVTLFQYDLASARQLDTGKASHVSKAELKRRKQVREMKAKKKDAKMAMYEEDDNMGVQDMDESDSDMSSDDEDAIANRSALGMCRVLHFAANRMPMQAEVEGNRAAMAAKGHHGVNFGDFAAVCVPQYVNRHGDFTQDKRRELSAADLVAQINLRNCALAVMSRFGLCDGALSGKQVVDSNVEYLESLHMIGAATVMYPMQNTGDQGGLNTLASIIFLIKFYAELPTFSRERLSVCMAHRKAMLWLRDQTATEIISWLDTIPIPSSQREDLILELEKYVDAATSGQDYGDTEDLPTVHEEEERVRPADRKFFSHFLLWGNFIVSGAGGKVHPKNLTEEGEDVHKDHLMYDNALNDIRMEIFMLKTERRFAEAKQLEKRLSELQAQAIKGKVDKVKYYGTLAARGLSDVLDALDKALLDQDEDEIDLENEAPPPDEGSQKQKVDKSYYVPKEKKQATIDLWERGEIPKTAPRYVPLPEALQKVGLDKLAETPTLISMMTSYVESLFPHGSKEEEEAFTKSRVKKLKVVKKKEELERKEMLLKMAERPDEYEHDIREKNREEKIKQIKMDYAPMYEELEAKKEEKQRLHVINHSQDNAIDHLKSESDSSACTVS